ncbi:BamA/TamA family outer membrane protein [Sulfurovum sp. zt1-1]|uniref:BamA/TamA family outer membrane protein n=1 Tax=Sulfurovum zhangzhouensis TaxID=3019067 RepID=A0ABT7QVS3_9BACT|nr:BamA/TamA family outer membrane protein [Sulfurovum zhangzhouensis]MDM5270947.1 BamA/TamA family outer membrane protein [Sulfurovum zhangzhouensis]
MLYRVIMIFFSIFLILSAEEIEVPTHQIMISGNTTHDTSKLYEVLSVETNSFWEFWKKDEPKIYDKLIPTLNQSLQSFYDSEGFYDAQFDIKETNTTLYLNIKENTPVHINDINVSSDYDISRYITFKKQERFRAQKFIDIKNNIIQAMLDQGYCSYDLDTKAYVDIKAHRVDLKYFLTKGDICKFDKTYIKGLESIDEEVILSRVVATEGSKFDPKSIKESYANLYQLDVFDSVMINYDRKFYNKIPVDITVQETGKPYHTELGLGFDTYLGLRTHGTLVKKNFMGNAQKLTLKALWSQKEYLASLDFFKPALFDIWGQSIDFMTKLGYSNLEYPGFTEAKSYLRFCVGYQRAKWKLKSGIVLENIDIQLLDNLKDDETLQQAVNEGNFLLLYPYIDVVYDARDDSFNPHSGYYLSSYLEYGLPYSQSASTYLKMQLEGRYIHSIDKLTMAAVLKTGVVDQFDGEVPESKLFFAGGAYFNRAYGFREMGVILSPTSDSIEGASTMLNVSLEADYPVWGDIYGAVFTDNTMLTDKSYDYSGDIITSAGVGVRYMTPIGPFKLDVGFNVNDPSQYGISFQVGQSF